MYIALILLLVLFLVGIRASLRFLMRPSSGDLCSQQPLENILDNIFIKICNTIV